jgi:hypothetical protein
MKKNHAYIAWGESPFVVCSYGETPGKALKKLGRLIDDCIKDDQETLVLGINCHYDEDNLFNANATLSRL